MRYVSEQRELENVARIEKDTIEKVYSLLSEYSHSIDEYLFSFVARLCDVDEKKMLEDSKYLKNVHARWFYWYSYRYMSGEEYKSIAQKHRDVRAFATSCITNSIRKMSAMIENYRIWGKRWGIVKRIIDAILTANNTEPFTQSATITLKVKTPKGINIELKQDK